MNTYPIIRQGLFLLPPETAHNLTLEMAHRFPALGAGWQYQENTRLRCQVGKTEWRTPIGLAAGLDKNAVALDFFSRLGFGSMECGTITVKAQLGNPKPRMFRYSKEFSLRNSMGFPNDGMDACIEKLKHRPNGFPIGVNIGKSKDSNPEEALSEYAELYTKLAPLADWVVVNISSPNTVGLRDLQQEDWLKKLFDTLHPLKAKIGKEIFVKLAPDLDDETLRQLTKTLSDLGADGLVATNTTHIPERGPGGVSGRLLRVKGHQKRRVVLELARDRNLPLVGVGGFEDYNDVLAWWAAGGDAFQIYTSFIYQGPQILRDIENNILDFLKRSKIENLQTFLNQVPKERQKLIGSFGR